MAVKKRGTKYQGRVQRPYGSWASATFRLKTDADKWNRRKLDENDRIRRGQLVEVDRAGAREPFAVFADRYLVTRRNVRSSTRANSESRMRKHVLPVFGKRPIATIQPSEIEAWLHGLADAGLTPSTANKNLDVLRQVLRLAQRDVGLP